MVLVFVYVVTAFPPFLENLENLENLKFCHLLFQAWKMLRICLKSEKSGILSQNLEKNIIFKNLMFPNWLLKMFLPKKIMCIYVISKLSTPTLRFKAKLTWDFVAFTWKKPRKYMEFHITREVGALYYLVEMSGWVEKYHFWEQALI